MRNPDTPPDRQPVRFNESELLELLRQFYSGQLEHGDSLQAYKKKAVLQAISYDKEPKAKRLVHDVVYEDMVEVIDRLRHTAVFYQGKILFGFYELALEVLLRLKDPGKGDLVLYPIPTGQHQQDAVHVYGHYLAEQLYGRGEPIAKLEARGVFKTNDCLLAPYSKEARKRMLEQELCGSAFSNG